MGGALNPPLEATLTLDERPLQQRAAVRRTAGSRQANRKVSEGTRTPDRLDHNQELYQLSYAHRVGY